jgi:sugar phosphate isomerase/epimerase
MVGCIGEDYSTLESIRRTGGIVPDATWEQNKINMQASADIAVKLAIKLVTFHAGFIPHEESNPDYDKLLKRVGDVADIFAARGIELTLETGQETADTLKAMLRKLGRANVGINFDPANLVLYDKGDPIQALRVLGQWVRQCHLKDAVRTKVPGTWGEEVVLGTGEVKWPDFFRALQEIKFNGNLNIEREAGQQRLKDIRTARQYVEAFA